MRELIWPKSYFERISKTFIEAWPSSLSALAIPQLGAILPTGVLEALDKEAPLWRATLMPDDAPGLHQLAELIQPGLNQWPNGIFICLGSASPKDSALFFNNKGRSTQTITAIKLLQTSARIRKHLSQFEKLAYQPSLFIKPWLNIQPWQEFRCFMQGRQWVGISQLNCAGYEVFPEIPQTGNRIVAALRTLLPQIAQFSHLETAAFDICVLSAPTTPEGCRAWLMDMNPWGPMTDACLFDWHRSNDFDGSFRYLTPNQQVARVNWNA